jgi:ABC-2 type transport system ATP-binding protein
MTDPVIKASNLTKYFGGVKAIDSIDLTVNKGDIYGVLGANGAGKTTTISTILGLIEATEGSIEVLGQYVGPNNNKALRHVGALVGDGPAFFPYMTGRENLLYMAKRFGVGDKRVDQISMTQRY